MPEMKSVTAEQVARFLLEEEGVDSLRESLHWVVQQLTEAEVSELASRSTPRFRSLSRLTVLLRESFGDPFAFNELGGSFRGELLLPTSPGYETARRIWNGAIDRRPACIARCTGVAAWLWR